MPTTLQLRRQTGVSAVTGSVGELIVDTARNDSAGMLTLHDGSTAGGVDVGLFELGSGKTHAYVPDTTVSVVVGQENANTTFIMQANGSLSIANGFNNFLEDGTSIGTGAINLGANGAAEADYTFIGSGQNNQANTTLAAVVGGSNNIAGNTATFIGSGTGNEATGEYSIVVGGANNKVILSNAASITSGANNLIEDTSHFAVVGGGSNNVSSNSEYIFIGGGADHNITDSLYITIGGGYRHSATNSYSVISGGANNSIFADYATVLGGRINTANGDYSIVGGDDCQSISGATYGIALGRRAVVNHTGATVIGDGTSTQVSSDYDNQFKVQAGGGWEFYSSGNTQHIVPQADSTYDLGSTSKRWATVYADTVDSAGLEFDSLQLEHLNADPSNPANNYSVIWASDGTGSGDAGDLLVKITVSGTTKTATIVDYSAV